MSNQQIKIGIFGGSFNPVHKGHVAIAKSFSEKLALDKLLVIPNRISPLKENSNVSGEERIHMLEIAFRGMEQAEISDIELLREGASYTCDTVAEIRKRFPDARLYLLIGDDWADGFRKWLNYRDILAQAQLVIANRSGRDINAACDSIESECGKRPIALMNEITPISSEEFRISNQKEHLPEGVFEYIQEKGLYGI